MNRNLIRFLLFIPASMAVYLLTRVFVSFFFTLMEVQYAMKLQETGGIQNYFLELLSIACINILSIAAMLYTGVLMVPKFKKAVYYGYLVLWVLMLIFSAFVAGRAYSTISWTFEVLLETGLLVASQGMAFVLVGRNVLKACDSEEVVEERSE